MAENENSSHKCVLCNNVLESKEALQEHFRKHANKEIDSKGRPSKMKLQKKVIKKEAAVPKKEKTDQIACDVCGMEFSDNSSAIQHKFKKHPNVIVKYVCPYCGKQFPIKALFDNHIGTHSSDKREKSSFLCDICGAEFYFEEAKLYHFKSTHERVQTLYQPIPTAPPSKKIRMNIAGEIQSVYYCHLCGCEYIVKFNLQKHLEKGHTEEERCFQLKFKTFTSRKPITASNLIQNFVKIQHKIPSDVIRCTTCEALFYNQKAYETHNVSHKSDDLYVTSEQQRLQTVSRVDQDFDIRRVQPLAAKYLPSFKRKQKSTKTDFKVKEEIKEEDLSPPSTPDSTDSDSNIHKQSPSPKTNSSENESDSDVPLVKLKENTEEKKFLQNSVMKKNKSSHHSNISKNVNLDS